MHKGLRQFKVIAVLFLVLFLVGCVIVSECDLGEFVEPIISILSFVLLGASIVLFVLNHKTKGKKIKQKTYVDDNILFARKIYKNAIKNTIGKLVKLTVILYSILMLTIITYYIVNFDKLMLIILTSLAIVMGCVLSATIYFTYKYFYFPYEEFVLNEESIVVFMSNRGVWSRFTQPCLHVVYDGKEYTEYGRSIWVGGNASTMLDDVLFSSLIEIINWFNDEKFSNFIKIKIKTKNSGNVQCVYKLGRRKFIISEKLEMLEGCFETSRSERKKRKKKTKKTNKI